MFSSQILGIIQQCILVPFLRRIRFILRSREHTHLIMRRIIQATHPMVHMRLLICMLTRITRNISTIRITFTHRIIRCLG
jgi:hypothetical protein